MKPLLRWTIGNVEPLGLEILSKSIKLAKKILNHFDFVICHNGIEEKILYKFNLPLYKQKENEFPLKLMKPAFTGDRQGSGWKLSPPRLRIESHELWVDNDLIIEKIFPSLETWLSGNYCIIAEGWYGVYGIYENLVRSLSKVPVCAGLFGLPPNFDFNLKIIEMSYGEECGWWDEQGMVSAIIVKTPDFKIIPLYELNNCQNEFKEGPFAHHFVDANRTKDKHLSWECYKKRRILFI